MMERRVKERLIGATLLVALVVLIVPEMLSGPRRASAPPLSVGMPTPTRSVSVDLNTSQATAEPDLPDAASAVPPAAAAAPPGTASAGAPSGNGSGVASDAASSVSAKGGGAADGASADSAPTAGAPTVTTLRAQESATREPSTREAAAQESQAREPAASTLESAAASPKSTQDGSRSEARSAAHEGRGRRAWAVQLGSFASRSNAERLVRQLQGRPGVSPYVSASGSRSSPRYRVRVGPLSDRGAAERVAARLRAAGHPVTLIAPAS